MKLKLAMADEVDTSHTDQPNPEAFAGFNNSFTENSFSRLTGMGFEKLPATELIEPDEREKQFIVLRASGMSYTKIQEQLGLTKPTLIKMAQQFKNEINEQKKIELDELREQYFMSKKARIELLGQRLESVSTELSTRDLKTLSTSKLFEIMLRLSVCLKQEFPGEDID